jgi:hypothetical protein
MFSFLPVGESSCMLSLCKWLHVSMLFVYRCFCFLEQSTIECVSHTWLCSSVWYTFYEVPQRAFFLLLGGPGVWTQGLELPRHMLYLLSHIPSSLPRDFQNHLYSDTQSLPRGMSLPTDSKCCPQA